MKHISMVIIGLTSLLGSVACNQVGLEISPEAAVSYGVPSQKSNSQQPQDIKKDQEEPKIGSSAILPKRRIDY